MMKTKETLSEDFISLLNSCHIVIDEDFNFLTEPDVPDNSDDSKYSVTDRGQYGVALVDLWDFGPSYFPLVLAQILRAYPTKNNMSLLEDLIFSSNSENYEFETIGREDFRSILDKTINHMKVINDNWVTKYSEFLNSLPFVTYPYRIFMSNHDFVENFGQLDIDDRNNWKDSLSDPILINFPNLKDKDILEKIFEERISYGISSYDIKYNPRGYLHWILVQSALFASSGQAMSFPPSFFDCEDPGDINSEDAFKQYSDSIHSFAKKMFFVGSNETKITEDFAEENFVNMFNTIRDLWD